MIVTSLLIDIAGSIPFLINKEELTYKTLHPTTADYIFSRARETCPN